MSIAAAVARVSELEQMLRFQSPGAAAQTSSASFGIQALALAGPARLVAGLTSEIRHAASTFQTSAGILTCCPSATPFGLVLGPD